jgi:putative intracellular protease/amidase
MKERGHTFDLISTDYVIQDEITMRPNRIKSLTIDTDPEIMRTDKYNGFMIVSGNMLDTEAYWNDGRVLHLIQVANAVGKPIAAICCSVPTVRFAAANKRVSFFPLVRSRALLQEAGAILQSVALTRDQNLVTAEHQMATQMWAEEFCNMLEGKEPQYVLQDSGWTPKGNERMPIPILEEMKQKADPDNYVAPVIRKPRPQEVV